MTAWTVVVPRAGVRVAEVDGSAPSLAWPPAPWIALLMGGVPDTWNTPMPPVAGMNVLGAVFPPVLVLQILPLPSHFRGSRCCRSQGCGGASRRCSWVFLGGHGTGEGVGGIERDRAGFGQGPNVASSRMMGGMFMEIQGYGLVLWSFPGQIGSKVQRSTNIYVGGPWTEPVRPLGRAE